MKDLLGDRIKANYEDRTRYMLPRRTFTIIRIDGKAFHTYTRGLQKPFDYDLMEDMDSAVQAVMPKIQGALFAYVQSDEISILLTDFNKEDTSAWFDGNIQKIVSVSASLMTAEFNRFRLIRGCGIESGDKYRNVPLACFDSRAFTIPDWIEVSNYFIWRNQDCLRNSLQMVARSMFSHKECDGKSCMELKKMVNDNGLDWDNYSEGARCGRIIKKEKLKVSLGAEPFLLSNAYLNEKAECRTGWVVNPAWVFTSNPEKLRSLVPVRV